MNQGDVQETLHSEIRGEGANPKSADRVTYTFYFGGELFSNKHLIGNAFLAEAIFQRSQGKFQAVLPQNLEQRDITPQGIRDQDLRSLLSCDLGLFHYDGAELDSGTIVEFMMAKFADIPAVIVRSDFRGAGDQGATGDPWNLMSSFFPRTANVVIDAMALYKQNLAAILPEAPVVKDALEYNRSGRAGQAMTITAADEIIAAFERALEMPSILPASMRKTVYQWLAIMPGFRHGEKQAMAEMLARCSEKEAKGLL